MKPTTRRRLLHFTGAVLAAAPCRARLRAELAVETDPGDRAADRRQRHRRHGAPGRWSRFRRNSASRWWWKTAPAPATRSAWGRSRKRTRRLHHPRQLLDPHRDAGDPLESGFDMADLAPIIPLGNMPVVMCFNPSKGYKKLSDFVAAAKANPGSVNYASAGAGNSSHLNGERFRLGGRLPGRPPAVQGRAGSDDRSDRRPRRLLFLSTGERAAVPEGGQAAGAWR